MTAAFRAVADALIVVCRIGKGITGRVKRYATQGWAQRREGDQGHPWYDGFAVNGIANCECLSHRSPEAIHATADLSAPILFLARAHSGTRALAKLLEASGVYIGSAQDEHSLNSTYDSLYWTYGFERYLVPKLFEWGVGCGVDERVVVTVGLECLRRHLSCFSGGPWGFKTCAAMFCHPLYRYLLPRARYIYLVRDGRDVVLSHRGIIHLTGSSPGQPHWEYFKIITFGISNDLHMCPFEFPETPRESEQLIRHRYWIQAKSWREHALMVSLLRQTGQLSPNVHMVRYEELCRDPVPTLEDLFHFLGIELTDDTKQLAARLLHTDSIGRWKDYRRYIGDSGEDMETVFASMEEELEELGYRE